MAATTIKERSPAFASPNPEHLGGGPDWRSAPAIAAGLEAAFQARAPGLHTSTPLVRKLAGRVSDQLGLDDSERLAIDLCAQLRDIGMIGLPDSLIQNTGALSPDDWALMNRHPVIGAVLLQTIPSMVPVAETVRAHHERWDGEGYPDGLAGEAIPLPSRVVAVCDSFVATATGRPHRRGAGAEGAVEYILQQCGSQFDPRTVDCLLETITGRKSSSLRSAPLGSRNRFVPPRVPVEDSERPGPRPGSPSRDLRFVSRPRQQPGRSAGRMRELSTVISDFGDVPAFAPACERVIATAAFVDPIDRGELVTAIESDIGLTVMVLRQAQLRSRSPVANIRDAASILTTQEIHAAIAQLPRMAFPCQTGSEELLLRSRIHASAVARAADRLAQVARPFEADDLIAAALVHDIGKLVLARARPEYAAALAAPHNPEDLVRRERREFGFDHGSLGGLLLERWGLAECLVTAVSAHHTAHRGSQAATFVRLADMLAHHAHGDVVDRNVMLRLASACEVSVKTLGDVVFDLPYSGGRQRPRVEHSPLSTRETVVLRLLASGHRTGDIARELDLSESTVRSHLHNTYSKLNVLDRVQAVLRATEKGWI